MKLNLKINSMLLCLALFAACSSDDDGQVAQDSSQEQKQPQKTYPLSIEVAENPMVQEGEGGSSRRAPIINNTTLTAFCMDYVYNTSEQGNNEATISPSGSWKAGDWPYGARDHDPEYNVNWYAHNSYTKSGGSAITSDFLLTGENRPYISFSVVEDASQQKDLLVATASGTYSGTNDGKLTFTFNHVCSALRFWVKKSTNLNDYTLNISNIVLRNVIKVGNYFFDTDSWVLGATSTVYTLYSGSAATLGSESYIPLDGGTPSYLFFIPQTLTAWSTTAALSDTYLEITCTIYKGSDKVFPAGEGNGTAYMPFGLTFEKGHQKNIKINIGKNSLYSAPNTKIIN